MEYTLQAIFYLIRGYINLLLQMEVTEGVTIGGISFSIMLLTGLFIMFKLIRIPKEDMSQPRLEDRGGRKPDIRGDNFTMR